MYFYSLSGDKFNFLEQLNSNCELNKLGLDNLNILLQMGESLKLDTLSRIRAGTNKDYIFNENLIEAKYENYREWNNTKTYK
jgi:hypothetical protein